MSLQDLGFSKTNFQNFDRIIREPYGIILVTGPTGSGKSTTLYAALNSVKSIEKNCITVEDPVEYQLPLINQVQVNIKKGLTFSAALRSMLRQDPDIIMVGEIRDSETGKIATEAALTGHLVLSTLHTNDATGAITRLTEMGVEPFLLAPSLLGVVAQRLLRRICEDCKERYSPKKSELQTLNIKNLPEGTMFSRGKGCVSCQQRGYRGRTAIHEVLVVDDNMRDLISEGSTTTVLTAHAKKHGFTDMRFDGTKK